MQTTAPVTPGRYGIQSDAPAQPTPLPSGRSIPLAEAPPPGWSMRELGSWPAIKVHQRGDSWAVDAFLLHVPEGADPISAAIRQRVDAIRAEMGQRVAKLTADSKVGKDFQAALAELNQHQQDAAGNARQLERLTAQRQAEALAERPSAAKLTKFDSEIADATAASRKADGLAATIAPLVSERRAALLREVELAAQTEFGKLMEEVMAKRKAAMTALAAAVGAPLMELLVADQVQRNFVMGTKAPAVAAAMKDLAAVPQ